MHEATNSTPSSVLSSGRIKKNDSVQLIPVGGQSGCPQVSVQPVKNGDTVVAIEVRCKCGETIKVDCLYE